MTQPRILLIEDEKQLAYSIQRHLNANKYEVDLAFDASQGETLLQTNVYALIILDIMLPGKSGLEFLEELRSQSDPTPVLVLSARDSVGDRVTGLHHGADDYLTKPFDSSELTARIEAVLRRSKASTEVLLEADDLTLDLIHRTVTRGGKAIALTPKEFTLLEFFLRNKNQILTRQRIAEQVWKQAYDLATNIVDVYVSYLRKSVDAGHSRKLIHTVHGEGFILRDD